MSFLSRHTHTHTLVYHTFTQLPSLITSPVSISKYFHSKSQIACIHIRNTCDAISFSFGNKYKFKIYHIWCVVWIKQNQKFMNLKCVTSIPRLYIAKYHIILYINTGGNNILFTCVYMKDFLNCVTCAIFNWNILFW